MGTFQLGRIGMENTVGEVHGWSSGSRGIRIQGHTQYGDVAEALIVREQLLGYVEQADEDFVPVVWSEQPEVNGFYRVQSVDIQSDPDKAPFGVLDWSAELVRVQGYAAPLVEMTMLAGVRPDTTGWSTYESGFSLPAASKSALETYDSIGVLSRYGVAARFTRPGDRGGALVCSARSTASRVAYYVEPGSFYDAAATLLVGNPLRVAVGRQIANVTDAWSITNGLLEVRPIPGDLFVLQYRMWVDNEWSAWETATFERDVSGDPSYNLAAPHTVTVLRNTPEAVTLRLLTATSWNPMAIDLTLRRGSRSVSAVWSQSNPFGFRLRFSNFGSPTALGNTGFSKTLGGVTKFCASNVDTNSPAGAFAPVNFPLEQWQLCFGLTDDAIRGSYTDDATRNVDEWFWASSEKQSVVAQ